MTKKTRAKTRRALLSLSLVLVTMMVAVGGTIAWLTDSSDTIINTFAPTGIEITLEESVDNNFDLIPGTVYPKDPTVTVEEGSEPCYVYVTIDENNIDDFVSYAVNTDNWTNVDGTENVYYYGTNGTLAVVDASAAAQELEEIIADNRVTIIADVTETQIEDLGNDYPTLTFKAYAVQSANLNATDIAGNWLKAQGQ